MQSSLFPVKAVSLDPSNLGTADCEFIGKGDDGIEYAIKTVLRNPAAPAAEWICYWVASVCGIATPVCNIITMPDGTKAFGSRWEGGVTSDQQIIHQIISGGISTPLLAGRLSAIYALDLFVWNLDRHANNYLFQKAHRDYRVLAFDFSRCWTVNPWPLPLGPLPFNCNTAMTYSAIRVTQPFDLAIALDTLHKIDSIPANKFTTMISEIPLLWLSKEQKAKIVKWWTSGERKSRVDYISKGLGNGTLL